MSLLRPGGRMAIVLPDGILSNRSTQYVREWIEEKSSIKAIISLPVETFSPFGANIKTSVLILRKNMVGEKILPDHKVFMADIQSVGYDGSGRNIVCDDFDFLSNAFCEFIEKEGW
jgi:type I restriction enzyme M protein